MEVESITKTVGAVSAVIAMAGGGYTLADKVGWLKKDILNWAPEHFQISSAPVSGEFTVVVARQKLRDDCEVVNFKLEVRDANYVVHPATPSIAVFSGPASATVDKFGYRFTIEQDHQQRVATGTATLLAHIKYKCPEGDVVVNYPNHPNLNFQIQE